MLLCIFKIKKSVQTRRTNYINIVLPIAPPRLGSQTGREKKKQQTMITSPDTKEKKLQVLSII
jgi:hypothetical protein